MRSQQPAEYVLIHLLSGRATDLEGPDQSDADAITIRVKT